jgi:hypothetical protein
VFKEIDLSRAVPRNTVSITFRYQITSRNGDVPLIAQLADNAQGQSPYLLTGHAGRVTVRLRTAQRLYYRLGDPALQLNLWVVEHQILARRSC